MKRWRMRNEANVNDVSLVPGTTACDVRLPCRHAFSEKFGAVEEILEFLSRHKR